MEPPEPPAVGGQPKPPGADRNRNFKPRSIEDQIRYAHYVPDPGAYDPRQPERFDQVPHGLISNAKVPSAIDGPARLNVHVPGPGAYHSQDREAFALPEGGRLNRRAPDVQMCDLKEVEYPHPAPGHYGCPTDPGKARQLYGRFGKEIKQTEFIRQEVLRSRSIPGPGAHETLESMESQKPFCPEGGRTLQSSKPASYFEQAPRQFESKPDPGRYELPGAINGSKAVGKLVYRYESSTMAESRKMVEKAVGAANQAPGPGTYNLPDPQPISHPPLVRGRELGHAMPHPFSYNCVPDLSRKFATPVRQQNSGDQIYGRDLKKGTAGKAHGKGARGDSDTDTVTAGELPTAMATSTADMSDPGVQWRSGGFSVMKKSKSATSVRAPVQEHVQLEEAARRYPTLSRKSRSSAQFLPMASRKNNGFDSVPTKAGSDEHRRFLRSKWQVDAVAQGLQNAAAVALEPLDEEKLRNQALMGLMDKAKERMRLEGVSHEQQELILAELPKVVEERGKQTGPAAQIEEDEYEDEGEVDAEMPPEGITA